MNLFLDKLHLINTFIFDVDGVLTDGIVHVTENGEQLRQFNIKDGYAIKLAIKQGFNMAIISGGTSQSVALRLNALGVKHVFLGVDSKVEILKQFLQSQRISAEQVLYMGDDIPDFSVMKMVGLATCPADAVEEIKAISHYISPKNGGKACVRDVIEKTLKAKKKWLDTDLSAIDGILT